MPHMQNVKNCLFRFKKIFFEVKVSILNMLTIMLQERSIVLICKMKYRRIY